MVDRIQGKVVVITGASGGIGVEIARAFAHAGARIVLSARNVPVLESLAAELRAGGTETMIAPSDVTSAGDMQKLVRDAVASFGAIDILVCNAGVYVRGAVEDLSLEIVRQCMETNYFGAVHVIREALPAMLARRTGHIVAIASVDGKKGLPPDAAYAASKYALTGFMDVLRQELRGTGVYASTIFPERVDTPMIRDLALPMMSRRLPPGIVARAVVRAVRQRRREMIVSFAGPKLLIVASAVWPALGDWLVRIFGLQGVELEKGTSHE
jgi:dehydrogenase/reductase SDR family member 7B